MRRLLRLLLVIALLPAAAWADGVTWGGLSSHDLVPENAQRAWVDWEGGREHLVVAVDPGAVSPRLAWMLPIPAPAKDVKLTLADKLPDWKGDEVRAQALLALDAVPGWLFIFVLLFVAYALRSRMAEVVVVFLILGVLSAIAIPKFGGSGGSRAAAEVEISGRAELGGLVSEVVAAPDVEALGRYLRYKSTQLPAGAFKALDALIKEGSCFVVSWAERPNLARSLAVDVSFPAAAPYYPMRLTSAYGRRKVALDLRVSGWQAPAAAVTGQPSARVGYYQDPGAGHRRFTRVLFKDRAQTLAEDWTFKPRRFAPRLTLAAFFAAYPLPGIVMLFALAGLTSAFLVGLTAFPDWRGPSGLPPLSALGLSQLVPFFGPAFVLRRLRPEPAAWPLKTRAAFWSLAPLFVAATLVLCRSLDGLWSDPRSTTSVIFRGLIQMSNEGATKGNLGAIRSASSIYIGDHGGAAPPDLSVLLKNGKYLGQLPLAKTPPHHPDSAAVRNMTGEQYAEEDFSDAGGWAYVFTGPSSGTVVVNCTHLDSRGKVWISY